MIRSLVMNTTQKEDYVVVALCSGGAEKWKKRLIFHVAVVRELSCSLKGSKGRGRNIDLNEYSTSHQVRWFRYCLGRFKVVQHAAS